MGTVAVLGSLNIDLVTTVDRHPRPGETVLGEDLTRVFGGKGANQAIAAAAMGAQVMMIGRVGDDDEGARYIERLKEFGVATDSVVVTPGHATGHALIPVSRDGENSIIVIGGANLQLTEEDLAPLDALGEGDVLLTVLEVPLPVVEAAVRRATSRGVRVVINVSPYAELAAEVLAAADPLIVNEHEARLLEESGVARSAQQYGGLSVLTTLGAEGARWKDISVPADKVSAVDTTGAGDAFCGALGAALAAGSDKRTAMEAATAAAAVAVQRRGAQPEP
ncbi:ribokinase [Saxibacter everestensis]|uniref:Ribokinase n=1 Tax=Saxibacter everestensis TaxID=2909229 RepID=A0ABY8QWW5_9MICO|nr:ribokinase [Brevibacteriaceae bacterium ZFBP1038]